jgi:hypothetical protein
MAGTILLCAESRLENRRVSTELKMLGVILKRKRSATRLAEKTATKKASLDAKRRRERSQGGPKSRTKAKTIAISQVHLGVVEGCF